MATQVDVPKGRRKTDFRKLWFATTTSASADGLAVSAGPLLAASLTRDPLLVAGLAAGQNLGSLIFSVYAGFLVDRFDRRGLLIFTNFVRAGLAALLVVAIITELHGLVLLYGVFFAFGLLEILGDHSSFSILPATVAHENLGRANSRLQGSELLAQKFAGPPAGGLLFGVSSALPFASQFLTYLLAAIGATYLQKRKVESPKNRNSLREEIGHGFALVWSSRLLRSLAVVYGLVQAVYVAGFSILVLFAREVLGLSSAGFGLLLASGAVGALIGATVGDRLILLLGPRLALSGILSATGAATVVIAAVHVPAVTAAMIGFMGFAAVVWKVVLVSQRQIVTADDSLGRVNGIYRMIGLGGMVTGALGGGLLADGFGLSAPFYFAAPILFLAAVLSYRALSVEI